MLGLVIVALTGLLGLVVVDAVLSAMHVRSSVKLTKK